MSDNPFGELPTPTHAPLDIMKLFEIVEGLAGYVGEGEVTADVVEAYATKKALPKGEVYAALIFDPTLQFVPSYGAKVEVCTGRCQLFGGIDLVDNLLAVRDGRLREGKAGFDVVPRNCLDQCDFPPIVRTVTSAGTYDHRNVTVDGLGEIISAACD